MKPDTHPNYEAVTVTCSCKNTFITRSTHKGDIKVEVCNKCHPFYTGTQRMVDTAGRVEKFMQRYASYNKKKTASQEEKH